MTADVEVFECAVRQRVREMTRQEFEVFVLETRSPDEARGAERQGRK